MHWEHVSSTVKEGLAKLRAMGYSNKDRMLSYLLEKSPYNQVLEVLKPAVLPDVAPGVTVRLNTAYGYEIQIECLVLVVADYLSKCIPKDK